MRFLYPLCQLGIGRWALGLGIGLGLGSHLGLGGLWAWSQLWAWSRFGLGQLGLGFNWVRVGLGVSWAWGHVSWAWGHISKFNNWRTAFMRGCSLRSPCNRCS